MDAADVISSTVSAPGGVGADSADVVVVEARRRASTILAG